MFSVSRQGQALKLEYEMILFTVSTFADNSTSITTLHSNVEDVVNEVDTIIRESDEVYANILRETWNLRSEAYHLNIPLKQEDEEITFTEYLNNFVPNYKEDVTKLNMMFTGGDDNTISACINISLHNIEVETVVKSIVTV